MISMSVTQNHGIDIRLRLEIERRILDSGLAALALKHPAIQQDALISDLNFVTRARHFSRGTVGDEFDIHGLDYERARKK